MVSSLRWLLHTVQVPRRARSSVEGGVFYVVSRFARDDRWLDRAGARAAYREYLGEASAAGAVAPLIHDTRKDRPVMPKQVSGPTLAPITLVWEPALGGRPRFAIETPRAIDFGGLRKGGSCKVWLDVDGHGTHRLPTTFVPWSFVMPTDDTDFQRDPPRASVDY